jgi:hypothetical protein
MLLFNTTLFGGPGATNTMDGGVADTTRGNTTRGNTTRDNTTPIDTVTEDLTGR